MLCNWIMVSFIIVARSKSQIIFYWFLNHLERPELNPSERVWQYIKQELSWRLYDTLDEIQEKVRSFLEEFSTETIASSAGWDYILSALATVA
jgi:hypothetical protein